MEHHVVPVQTKSMGRVFDAAEFATNKRKHTLEDNTLELTIVPKYNSNS